MSYTILHISDLHRTPGDPIGNATLVSSLVSDFERAQRETPQICAPDAIVVSGDVIQGVTLSAADHVSAIADQYEVALELIGSLTDRFLDGDRSRVVMVPGNHDVDWNTAYAAMELIPDDHLPSNLSRSSFGPASDFRWDWKERRAYRITDRPAYDRRLDHYRKFVTDFYADVRLPYPLDSAADYWLFELNCGKIGVAGFNSCHGNDCFAYHGAIAADSLAEAHMTLHDRRPRYDLMMAVWHHHVEGPPDATDYMDVASVYALIGNGFRLGLHGHQHRAQIANRYIHLPQQEPMAVVSAGSLCAGYPELPPGVNRQYNIIEIADDHSSIKVHIREMVIAAVFGPARRQEFGGKSYIDMELGKPLYGHSGRARDDARILGAERELANTNASRALSILRGVDTSLNSYGRTLMIRAATEASDWDVVVEVISSPDSIGELVQLIRALVELKQFDKATATLDKFREALDLDSATQSDLRSFIAAQRSLK